MRNKRTKLLILAGFLVLLLVPTGLAFAQDSAPPTTFSGLLDLLLANGGVGLVGLVGWLLSWLLEDWQWFNKLAPKIKQVSVFSFSVVLGVLVQWLKASPEIVSALQPWLDYIVVSSGIWVTSQIAHKFDKSPKG